MAKTKSSRKPARRAKQTMALKVDGTASSHRRTKPAKLQHPLPPTGFMVFIADDRDRVYIDYTTEPDALVRRLQNSHASDLDMVCKWPATHDDADLVRFYLRAAEIRNCWFHRTHELRYVERALPTYVRATWEKDRLLNRRSEAH